MTFLAELIVNGAFTGSLYALIALAFVVVYKASRVVNFALGELVAFASGFVALGLHWLGAGLAVAIVFGCLCMAVCLAAFSRVVLRRLAGRPVVALLMVTIGLGASLRGLTALGFAGIPRQFVLPVPTETVTLAGMLISLDEMAVAFIGLTVVAVVSIGFVRSRSGVALRAIADDPTASMAMGIDVQWHLAFAWVLAGILAVIGGVLWTSVAGGGFGLVLVGLKVFPIVIIGGIDSIRGAIAGAMLIGVIESVASGYLDPVVGGGISSVTAYVVLIAILIVRPTGLFGRRVATRV